MEKTTYRICGDQAVDTPQNLIRVLRNQGAKKLALA
jgi:hypothetical protein